MAQEQVKLRRDELVCFMDFPRDVTAQTREVAYAVYQELSQGAPKALGLNFSATDYMNSAGIGLIINIVEDALHSSMKVYAYGLGSHYRKLFGMVGLNERLIMVTSESELRERAMGE